MSNLSTWWRCCLVSAAAACGPKSTEHRRVVMAPPTVAAAPVDEPPASDFAWHTGARKYDAADPAGSPGVVWRVEIGSALVHPLVTDGKQVCGVGAGSVFCIDSDGTEIWRSPVDATGGVGLREAGVAVPTANNTIVDLDRERGTVSATHEAGGVATGWPVPVGGELVWVTEEGKVVSEAGWTAPASDSAVGLPASDGLHIYFGTKTGEVVAASRARARWRAVLPGSIVGGLVSADGMVYAAYTGELGRPGGVAALVADSGAIAWRTPLTDDPTAGPALSHVLVVPDRSGEIVGLDPATGDVNWRVSVAGAPSTSAAFGRFGLYIGNADGRLHRFDPDDGGEVWAVPLGATPSANPVIIDGKVVVGLTDGSVVAVGER